MMQKESHLKSLYENWFITLLGCFVIYIVYYNVKIYYLKRKFNAYQANYIPGSGWFFSRNPIMMLNAKRNGTLLQVVWKLFEEAGKNFRIVIGGSELFVTLDPENIKAVLATQFNDFVLGFRNAHFKPLLGDGIFTLDGEGWKHSRAMLRPNFSREKVAHVQSLEAHLQTLAKHIRKHDGFKLDIQDLFFILTVDTSTEFLFGASIHGLKDESIGEYPEIDFEGRDKFFDSFTASQAYLATRAWSQDWYWLFNNSKFKENNKVVHDFAKYYVHKALTATPEEVEERSKGGYVFLYELVKETRNPQVLQDQLLNIMIAGRDTTAGLLSFTMFELARNPAIWEKVKEDVYSHFGKGDSARVEEISFESLKKCEYLKWVIQEVLRLYPSVPINYRVATKNTTLPRGGGPDGLSPVIIEKGRVIGYVISSTHRNPEFYGKDASVFRPERWSDKNLKPGWAYLPFNGGPRICLGQQFALTEASYIICRLAQMFPSLKSQDLSNIYPPKMSSHLTSSLTDGCWISLS
ncbi:uncharacterized protein PRCAT00003546001 [Priceomyces carsonii]|uniref:uncharacterized protein n=1 Tax=Priceomyces carsonii TaxID=28549 RepID=UPI002ED7D06E|nr:unnamed protein product [Priceomyces carsonii]